MEKIIKASDTTELLGITLDKNINFKQRIQYICHKANNKTKPLFRIRKFLNLEQTQVLAEAITWIKQLQNKILLVKYDAI